MATRAEMEAVEKARDAALEQIADLEAALAATGVDPNEEPPDDVGILESLSRIMRDVQKIGKDRRTEAQGKYAYRGVDDVLDTFGPVLRRHGVIFVPRLVDLEHRDVTTSGGKASHEVIVQVAYEAYNLSGASLLIGPFPGESADSSDKATSQAMSVALRTAYLQTFTVPTGDIDPDEKSVDRAVKGTPAPTEAQLAVERAEAEAKELGWESAAQLAENWQAMLDNQAKIPEDKLAPVMEWGASIKLGPDTFTLDIAQEWYSKLEAVYTEAQQETNAAADALQEQFPGAVEDHGDPDPDADEQARAVAERDARIEAAGQGEEPF